MVKIILLNFGALSGSGFTMEYEFNSFHKELNSYSS